MTNLMIGHLTDDGCIPHPATASELLAPLARQPTEATPQHGSLDRNTLLTVVTDSNARVITENRAQAAQFRAVLENMAQGVCLFDGEQRLVVCNDRYAEIYGLRAEHVQPGATLRDIVEQRYHTDCHNR